MHSRIFEILPLDYKAEDVWTEIPDWWVSENCDYVDEVDSKDRKQSIKYYLSDEDVRGEIITFTKNHLLKSWEKFRESMDKIQNFTKDKFLSGDSDLSWVMYDLSESYNSHTGVWFLDVNGDIYTKDDMERMGGVYKIGRIWDYHF